MGYRPNASAKGVRTGRFDCVALVQAPRLGFDRVPLGFLTGLVAELELHSKHLTYAHLPADTEGASIHGCKLFHQQHVDGVVVFHNPWHRAQLRQLDSLGFPSVHINRVQPANAVYADEYGAARDATEHLLRLGHRRIVLLRRLTWVSVALAERERGYRDAMTKAGAVPSVMDFESGEENLEMHERGMHWHCVSREIGQWLRGSDRPTAILAADVVEAISVLNVMLQSGVRPGSEVSLVGFSDWIINFGGLPIDTMMIDTGPMAKDAAKMVLSRIDNPSRDLPSSVHAYRLLGSLTTGPPA